MRLYKFVGDDHSTDGSDADVDGNGPDVDVFATPAAPQTDSIIFAKLPPEVRSQIFAYALTDYLDPSEAKQYSATTYYTRPEYIAPRRSDTALLRTCRAVYVETWFLPYQLRTHSFWLAQPERAPPEYRAPTTSRAALDTWAARAQVSQQTLGFAPKPEIHSMRVFAQMYKLQEGALADLLHNNALAPRQLILTIRHADWWWWERDHALFFEANWLEGVSRALPSCLREFRIELETVSRKRAQLEAIAKQMSEKWYFWRGGEGDEEDRAVLYPDATRKLVSESSWEGSSEWGGRRWYSDELEEGKTEFIIMSIPFRVEHEIKRAGGEISSVAREMAEEDVFDQGKMRLSCEREVRLFMHDFDEESDWGEESEEEFDEEEEEEEDEEDDEEDDEEGEVEEE